jgi:hypothetical protein
MGYEKGIGIMRDHVYGNYIGRQLHRHINYCATKVQMQYGNIVT